MLALSNISKSYGALPVLHHVELIVEEGEFVVLVGPSGCGKSTLLRSIAGLESINDGAIAIDGRDITEAQPSDREVAMVFQNYALYPHFTVRQNMGFGLKMAKVPANQIAAAVDRAARTLKITDLLDKYPKALSGGQKQRVAIGRAITRSPKVFLFDEPLSNLDATLRAQMRVELSRLHSELGSTMIYVTHDQVEAMTMADRIVVMNRGRIEQVGSPADLYQRPANVFVASFLGSPQMNLLQGRVQDLHSDGCTVTAGGTDRMKVQLRDDLSPPQVGEPVVIGIRPEDLAPAETGLSGRVSVVEDLGRDVLVYVDAAPIRLADTGQGTEYLSFFVPPGGMPAVGSHITVTAPEDRLYLFDSTGRTVSRPRPPKV